MTVIQFHATSFYIISDNSIFSSHLGRVTLTSRSTTSWTSRCTAPTPLPLPADTWRHTLTPWRHCQRLRASWHCRHLQNNLQHPRDLRACPSVVHRSPVWTSCSGLPGPQCRPHWPRALWMTPSCTYRHTWPSVPVTRARAVSGPREVQESWPPTPPCTSHRVTRNSNSRTTQPLEVLHLKTLSSALRVCFRH